MRAMTITNVRTINRVRHQDVEKAIMQGPTRLENLKFRKNGLDISSNRTEPSLFFKALIGSSLGHVRFQLLSPLQGFEVGTVGQSKVVADGSFPYLGSGTRSHATPPKFPGSGFSNYLVPIGQNVLFPNP